MRGTAPTPTAGPPSVSRLRRGGRRGVALAVAGLMGVGGLATLGTSLAAAAVPTFPDNVVVFPDRDFITIEGYQDHVGETATGRGQARGQGHRLRQGRGRGRRRGLRDQPPRRLLLGCRHGSQRDPRHQAGDVATITFPDGETGDTTTSSAMVTSDARARRRRTRDGHRHLRRRRQHRADGTAHHQPRPGDDGGGHARHPRRLRRRSTPRAQGRVLAPSLDVRRRHLHGHVRLRRPGRGQDRSQADRVERRCPGRTRTPTATGRA